MGNAARLPSPDDAIRPAGVRLCRCTPRPVTLLAVRRPRFRLYRTRT